MKNNKYLKNILCVAALAGAMTVFAACSDNADKQGKNEEPTQALSVSEDKNLASGDETKEQASGAFEKTEEVAEDISLYSLGGEEVRFKETDAEYTIYEDDTYDYYIGSASGSLELILAQSKDKLLQITTDEEKISVVKDYIKKVYPELDILSGEWKVEANDISDSVNYYTDIIGEKSCVISFIFNKEGRLYAANIFVNGNGEVKAAEIDKEKAVELAKAAVLGYIEKEKADGIVFVAHDTDKLVPEVNVNVIKGVNYWHVVFNNTALEGNPDLVEPYHYCCDVNSVTGEIINLDKSK